VRGILSTLATVWRIASPYFRSEDRWAARLLLAYMPDSWEQRPPAGPVTAAMAWPV